MTSQDDKGFIISHRELMILLNELYLENGTLNISYPFYNIHLFSLKPAEDGFIIKRPVDHRSFMAARKKHMPSGGIFDQDCPTFNDLREAYVVAGIIPFPNIREIYQDIANIQMMTEKSFRTVFFALDTNVAYLRFFTRNFPATVDRRQLTLNRFRFVISEYVYWELDNMINGKYSPEAIRKMTEKFSRSYLVEGFFNASDKKSRRAKDALVELHTLKRRYGAVKALGEGDISEMGKEERDIAIAESYYNFQKRENAFLVMVTADEDMVAHSMERELDHIFIKYPPEHVPDRGSKDPWSVVNLLYTIALRMGAVTVENYGIDIVGEWYGKNMDSYNREQLKVYFNGNQSIKKRFMQSLDISRKITSIIGESEEEVY